MRKLTLGIALASIVAVGTAYYNRTTLITWAAGEMLESRLNGAISNIERTPFDLLISADVTRQFVNDRHGGLYGARKAFLDKYLCGPVFGDKHDGYDKQKNMNSACFDVLYADNGSDVSHWYGKQGIPVFAAPLVARFRATMMQKARDHLADPAHLRAFYEARKQLAVSYIRGLNADERKQTIECLESAQVAFATFYRPQVQEAYALVVKTEHDWRNHYSNPDEQRAGTTVSLSLDQLDDELGPFKKWEAANAHLRTVSANAGIAMFAGRRHSEGGRQVIETYATITADLLTIVK